MPKPEWKIDQPPVGDMMLPVRCMHCQAIYDIARVHVTARYSDCSVWTSPCCGVCGIDDRPWTRDRHYREISREQARRGDDYDFYDVYVRYRT